METNIHLGNEFPLKHRTTLKHKTQNFSKSSGYKIFVYKSTEQIIKKNEIFYTEDKNFKFDRKKTRSTTGSFYNAKADPYIKQFRSSDLDTIDKLFKSTSMMINGAEVFVNSPIMASRLKK